MNGLYIPELLRLLIPERTRGKAGKEYPVVTRTPTGQAKCASARCRLTLRGIGGLSALVRGRHLPKSSFLLQAKFSRTHTGGLILVFKH